MPKNGAQKWGQIYDNIYGFVRLTSTEEAIINSAYYQRLRWIKQLGFASYIFDGAEHTRFAHAIGVCHSADQMIRAVGLGVPQKQLFNPRATDAATMVHKSIRIAALLHDIGTFPFSHSIEGAYIRHGYALQKKGQLPGKQLPNNHEHLGSYIIKNTDFEGGITHILGRDRIDFALVSKFIKGDSTNLVANQILHSDIDADRMDYLIRDAHHTGIRYGQVDREYLLYHMTTFKDARGRLALGVKENALHAAEDFLLSRFSWYSQVVRNADSAKFDVLAADITAYLLKENLIYSFQELLELAAKNAERFFGFNDVYFMNVIQNLYWNNSVRDPRMREKMKMLIYRVPPKTVRTEEFDQQLFDAHNPKDKEAQRAKALRRFQHKLKQVEQCVEKYGTGKEWVIADVPSKDLYFMQDLGDRIVTKDGVPLSPQRRRKYLIEKFRSVANFIPYVYANEPALALLRAKKVIPQI